MASAVSAMEMKDSGSFDAAYVKRDVHPIDQDHVLILSDSKGTSKNPNGYLDGFATTISDLVDLTQGNGSQQGYVIYSNGADQEIVKISGTVTTKMKDGHPDTSFQGTWVIVKATGRLNGARGEGTYSGYFAAEDKFHVDWQGQTAKLKMTENAK
jgi:hypothetical protein